MTDTIENTEPSASERNSRLVLEKQLIDVVRAFRRHQAEGNITVHIAEQGDFVAILPMSEEEAKDLTQLLARMPS